MYINENVSNIYKQLRFTDKVYVPVHIINITIVMFCDTIVVCGIASQLPLSADKRQGCWNYYLFSVYRYRRIVCFYFYDRAQYLEIFSTFHFYTIMMYTHTTSENV